MTLTLRRPDDCHLHLRDGAMLAAVLPYSTARFARAIIMPNLQPPLTGVAAVTAYRQRIQAACPPGSDFQPLMTLYLTDLTTPETIAEAVASGFIIAAKLYPAGATTNAEAGVTDLANCLATLQAMAELDMPLLVHGEVSDPAVDPFAREAVFLERHLAPLLEQVPDLRIVLEHVTTEEGIMFVRQAGERIAATLTPHHLRYTRDDLFRGGLQPHLYCLPVLKHARHRDALLEAAFSGEPRFFLGTDSAPHPRSQKEGPQARAGIFNAPAALELYAEVFAEHDALDRLEGFASEFGAQFYGLPRNEGTVTLKPTTWQMPESLTYGDGEIVPVRAGQPLAWQLKAT